MIVAVTSAKLKGAQRGLKRVFTRDVTCVPNVLHHEIENGFQLADVVARRAHFGHQKTQATHQRITGASDAITRQPPEDFDTSFQRRNFVRA